MRKISLLSSFLGAAILASCSGGNAINGTVRGASDGDYVYLLDIDEEVDTLAKAKISAQKFSMEYTAESPQVLFLVYENDDYHYYSEIVVEKGNIDVKLDENSKVTGTPNNDLLAGLRDKLNKSQETYSKLVSDFANCRDSVLFLELDQKIKEMNKEYDNIINGFLNENINSVAGLYILEQTLPLFSEEQVKTFLESVSEENRQLEYYKRVEEKINKELSTNAGHEIIDFTMNDMDGVERRFSELIQEHQLTLVDFWATWCGPCMAEIPELRKFVEEFKDKDIQVVGISLDSDRNKWLKTIKKEKMNWTHLSDLKQWDNEAARLYNVQAIPCLMLVDRSGYIISKGASLEEVRASVLEVLGE